jgi:hypothetical protein
LFSFRPDKEIGFYAAAKKKVQSEF